MGKPSAFITTGSPSTYEKNRGYERFLIIHIRNVTFLIVMDLNSLWLDEKKRTDGPRNPYDV